MKVIDWLKGPILVRSAGSAGSIIFTDALCPCIMGHNRASSVRGVRLIGIEDDCRVDQWILHITEFQIEKLVD